MALNPQDVTDKALTLSEQPLEIILAIANFLPLRSYEALSCSNKYTYNILRSKRRLPLTKNQTEDMNQLIKLITRVDNTYKDLVLDKCLKPITLLALTHLATTKNQKFLIVTRSSNFNKWLKTYTKLTNRKFAVIEPYVIESFGKTYSKDVHEDILARKLTGKNIVIIYHQMFRGSDFARFIYQYGWAAVLFDNLDIQTARNYYNRNMKYIKLSTHPKKTNYYRLDPELEPRHSIIRSTQILNITVLNETNGSNLIAQRISSLIEPNKRILVLGYLFPDAFRNISYYRVDEILSPTFSWINIFKSLQNKHSQIYFNPKLEIYSSMKNSISILDFSFSIDKLSAFIQRAGSVIYINRESSLRSSHHMHYIIKRMKKSRTCFSNTYLTHIVIQDKYTKKAMKYYSYNKQLPWRIITKFNINYEISEFHTQNLYLAYANALDMYLAKNIIRVNGIKHIHDKNTILDFKYTLDILIDISKLSNFDCPDFYLYRMLSFWNMTQTEQNMIVSGRKIRFRNQRRNMDNFRMWLFGNNDPNPKYKRTESAAKRIKLS